MNIGKHDTRRCRIRDFVELSLDILRTAVMFSEICKIKNNLKCIKFHISGSYSKQGSMTHNLFNSSHASICEYVRLNLESTAINVTSVTQ